MRGQRSLLLGPARLCLRLLLLLGYRRRCPPLLRGLVQRWRYGKVCLRSLLYNSFGGSDTAVDAAFEPIYWLVDNVIRWFGVVSDGALGARKGDVSDGLSLSFGGSFPSSEVLSLPAYCSLMVS